MTKYVNAKYIQTLIDKHEKIISSNNERIGRIKINMAYNGAWHDDECDFLREQCEKSQAIICELKGLLDE